MRNSLDELGRNLPRFNSRDGIMSVRSASCSASSWSSTRRGAFTGRAPRRQWTGCRLFVCAPTQRNLVAYCVLSQLHRQMPQPGHVDAPWRRHMESCWIEFVRGLDSNAVQFDNHANPADRTETGLIDETMLRTPCSLNTRTFTALPIDKLAQIRALLNRPIRRLDLTSKNTRAFTATGFQ